MRPLPVIADCTLSADGLAAQRSRAEALRAAVVTVERAPSALTVTFGDDADRDVLAELIEVERGCCTFLSLGYDDGARELTIAATEGHEDVLDLFGAAFAREAA